MTNEEKIRCMSISELATRLACPQDSEEFGEERCFKYKSCIECIKHWLQEEAQDTKITGRG